MLRILPPYYGSDFIMHKPPTAYGMERIDLWRFKSMKSGKVYLTDVEVYAKHIYGVKFYLKSQAYKSNRYSYKTNDFEPRRIVLSVIYIMRHYYESDPQASFAFIGESDKGESKALTKRFRFYRAMVNTFFGLDKFEHCSDAANSAYLLLRKNEIKQGRLIIKEIEDFFKQIYILG